MVSLQVLDLSRNNLVKLSPGTFVGLTELSYLDVGVNSLRTVSKSTLIFEKISTGITISLNLGLLYQKDISKLTISL